MGQPITFTVTAETLEAVRNLQAFAEQVQQGFKKTELAAASAGVKVQEFTTQASRGLQKAAEAAARLREQMSQLRPNPTGGGQDFAGRGTGNWFNPGQMAIVAGGLGMLAGRAANARMVYMSLGSSIQAVASSAILGLNPLRALAVQLPELVQTGALAGVGFGTMGAGLLALTPLLVTGGFAMAAYKARLYEAATAASLLAQTQEFLAKNTKYLEEAKDKHLIDRKDFDYINQLLKLGTISSLRAAQSEMQRLGIAPEQLAAAEKFNQLMHDARQAGLGSSVEAERMRALDAYETKLREIQELVDKNAALKPQQAQANAAAKAEYDAKLASLKIQENKEIETAAIKRLEADVAQFQSENIDRHVAKAQRQFDIEAAAYTQLYRNQVIDLDRYNELWNAANLKRIAGIHQEQEEEKQKSATVADLRLRLRQAGRDDLQSKLDGIDSQYNREIDKVQALNLALEEQNRLIAEINAARDRETDSAIADYAKEQTKEAERQRQAIRNIQEQQVTGTRNMFANMALAAKAFGQKGFAAYKAFAIAAAIVDTAQAAIAAYRSVVGIPYVGPVLAPIAAAAAVAAGAAQISVISGQQYDRGGYTGDGGRYEQAGIVHKGEFVMSADRTREYRPMLEAMQSGRLLGAGGLQGGGSPVVNTKVVVVGDTRAAALEAMNTPAGTDIIIQTIKGRRLDLGLNT